MSPVLASEPVHDLRTDVAKIPLARIADATLAGVSHDREEIRVAQVRRRPLVREFVGEAMERAPKRVEPEVPREAGRSRRLPISPGAGDFEDTVGRRAGGG